MIVQLCESPAHLPSLDLAWTLKPKSLHAYDIERKTVHFEALSSPRNRVCTGVAVKLPPPAGRERVNELLVSWLLILCMCCSCLCR